MYNAKKDAQVGVFLIQSQTEVGRGRLVLCQGVIHSTVLPLARIRETACFYLQGCQNSGQFFLISQELLKQENIFFSTAAEQAVFRHIKSGEGGKVAQSRPFLQNTAGR